MKKMYFFDFDGTLTYKDTMFLFLKFYNPSKFNAQFIKHIPLFVLVKMKLGDAEKIKRSFIGSILRGQTRKKIELKAQEFFDQFYPEIIRENALDFIKNIDSQNTESYLVTASLDIWVRPFAEKFKMNLIATEAEFKDDIFTGKFIGKNCNGPEKLKRIQSAIAGKKYDKAVGFGDTDGDKEMLDWVDEGLFKFFH